MRPEFQFERVRVQVVLAVQVRLVEFPDIVIHQGHRHEKGDLAGMVAFDDVEEFGFLVSGEDALEIP